MKPTVFEEKTQKESKTSSIMTNAHSLLLDFVSLLRSPKVGSCHYCVSIDSSHQLSCFNVTFLKPNVNLKNFKQF